MTITTADFVNGMTFGLSSILLPSTQKSNFIDIPTDTTQLLIFIAVLLFIVICAGIATYNLTHSWVQVILSVLFGFVYMSLAYIYYGLSGYKISK